MEKYNRYKEALDAYNKAIELSAKGGSASGGNHIIMRMALISKSMILLDAQKYDEAMECLDKTLKLTPDNINVWNLKANVFYRTGKLEDALKAFDKITELEPENAAVWYQKAYILRSLETFEDSLRAYEKVIEINPEHVDAMCGKGFVKCFKRFIILLGVFQ